MYKFLILLLLSSCAPINNKIVFAGDNNFTNDERVEIMEAIKIWNTTLDGLVSIDIKFDNVKSNQLLTIYKATDGWKRALAFSYYSKVFWGLAIIKSGNIFIFQTNFKDKTLFKRVIVHEIGHILLRSAWHSSNKNSIMFYTVGWRVEKEELTYIENIYKKR